MWLCRASFKCFLPGEEQLSSAYRHLPVGNCQLIGTDNEADRMDL